MKKYRKEILIWACILVLISGFLFFYIYNNSIRNCVQVGSYSCLDSLFQESYVPFLFTPLFLLASSLFVLFFSERVFKVWKMFSFFAIPIMIIWVALTNANPAQCSIFLCINRTFVVFFSGILYFILTVLITTISAFRLKIKYQK